MITGGVLVVLGSAAAFAMRRVQLGRREAQRRAWRDAARQRHAAIWNSMIQNRQV